MPIIAPSKVTALINKIKNAIDIHERRYGNSLVSNDLCEIINVKLAEIDSIRLIRNKFAHYCWSRDSDDKIFGTGFLHKQSKFSKPNEGVIVITNKEIEEIVGSLFTILFTILIFPLYNVRSRII